MVPAPYTYIFLPLEARGKAASIQYKSNRMAITTYNIDMQVLTILYINLLQKNNYLHLQIYVLLIKFLE